MRSLGLSFLALLLVSNLVYCAEKEAEFDDDQDFAVDRVKESTTKPTRLRLQTKGKVSPAKTAKLQAFPATSFRSDGEATYTGNDGGRVTSWAPGVNSNGYNSRSGQSWSNGQNWGNQFNRGSAYLNDGSYSYAPGALVNGQPAYNGQAGYYDDGSYRGSQAYTNLGLYAYGNPGSDFPLFNGPPQTGFQCGKDAQYPGYYADTSSGCQAFHICQANGKQDSFVCPNATLFNQRTFVCDFWWNVDCAKAANYYALNGDLYAVDGLADRKSPIYRDFLQSDAGLPLANGRPLNVRPASRPFNPAMDPLTQAELLRRNAANGGADAGNIVRRVNANGVESPVLRSAGGTLQATPNGAAPRGGVVLRNQFGTGRSGLAGGNSNNGGRNYQNQFVYPGSQTVPLTGSARPRAVNTQDDLIQDDRRAKEEKSGFGVRTRTVPLSSGGFVQNGAVEPITTYSLTETPSSGTTYDRNGVPVAGVTYDQNGVPVAGVTYDQNGVPISGVAYDQNGVPLNGVRYDQNGVPINRVTYNRNGVAVPNGNYDQNGVLIRGNSFDRTLSNGGRVLVQSNPDVRSTARTLMANGFLQPGARAVVQGSGKGGNTFLLQSNPTTTRSGPREVQLNVFDENNSRSAVTYRELEGISQKAQ
ncbi:hypothetical protein HDE_01907 [Halotydeus destructor]|nr:hypothetical protein HDE_01907 [Halotydeus destructor]